MTLIGENIHIISPSIKEAIIKKDEEFILRLVDKQVKNGISVVDLNVGPAKNQLEGALPWLVSLIQEKYPELDFSLDTTNINEMKHGFELVKKPGTTFLNSASADAERLSNTTELAKEYDSNLIALTLSSQGGIPKTPDERLELAFEINAVTMNCEIDNSKLYFDPLILPVSVDQTQALVALETIRMFKESFDPVVNTVIGLSNISNGSTKSLRPLINRVFFVLALGYGLDSAIVDGCDEEIIKIYNLIKSKKAETELDGLYLSLYDMAENFGELEEISYNKNDVSQKNVYKTAQILLNKEIYSHSYLEN